jgi:hypothetical protein
LLGNHFSLVATPASLQALAIRVSTILFVEVLIASPQTGAKPQLLYSVCGQAAFLDQNRTIASLQNCLDILFRIS